MNSVSQALFHYACNRNEYFPIFIAHLHFNWIEFTRLLWISMFCRVANRNEIRNESGFSQFNRKVSTGSFSCVFVSVQEFYAKILKYEIIFSVNSYHGKHLRSIHGWKMCGFSLRSGAYSLSLHVIPKQLKIITDAHKSRSDHKSSSGSSPLLQCGLLWRQATATLQWNCQ